MTESLESVLSLQPDWLKQRTTETAIWAYAELRKTMVTQVLNEKLWRGEPSPQLRSEPNWPAVLTFARRYVTASQAGAKAN
jgi:hypothetical protein